MFLNVITAARRIQFDFLCDDVMWRDGEERASSRVSMRQGSS